MPRDKAYLVIVQVAGKTRGFLEESYEETKELTESAGGIVVGVSRAHVPHPSPSHFIREGKLQEVMIEAQKAGANCLLFNVDLSPVQARNIEKTVKIPAIE